MSTATSEVVAPYAQALLSIAQSKNSVDDINQIAGDFLTLIKSSDELSQFLANPIVGKDAKRGVINRLLGDDANQQMKNFMLLLIDKGRIILIEPILEEFRSLVRALNQTVLAEVISAVALTDEQRETVRQKVQQMTDAKSVELTTQVDADLIGGVIVKVGSKVLDASVRGQLRRIGLQLGVS